MFCFNNDSWIMYLTIGHMLSIGNESKSKYRKPLICFIHIWIAYINIIFLYLSKIIISCWYFCFCTLKCYQSLLKILYHPQFEEDATERIIRASQKYLQHIIFFRYTYIFAIPKFWFQFHNSSNLLKVISIDCTNAGSGLDL